MARHAPELVAGMNRNTQASFTQDRSAMIGVVSVIKKIMISGALA